MQIYETNRTEHEMRNSAEIEISKKNQKKKHGKALHCTC